MVRTYAGELRCSFCFFLGGGGRWTLKGYAARACLVNKYTLQRKRPQNRRNAPLASAHCVPGGGARARRARIARSGRGGCGGRGGRRARGGRGARAERGGRGARRARGGRGGRAGRGASRSPSVLPPRTRPSTSMHGPRLPTPRPSPSKMFRTPSLDRVVSAASRQNVDRLLFVASFAEKRSARTPSALKRHCKREPKNRVGFRILPRKQGARAE